MEENTVLSLIESFRAFVTEANQYFEKAEAAIPGPGKKDFWKTKEPDDYWDALPKTLQIEAGRLEKQLVLFAGQFSIKVKSSPLANETDQRDMLVAIKAMRSALMMRNYVYHDVDVIHNEGFVLGVQPAYQHDDIPLEPNIAKRNFNTQAVTLLKIGELVEAGGMLALSSDISTERPISRYRRDTAFIMMSMDKSKPELDDVLDGIKEVFAQFNITAKRADEIEHEDRITDRVLNEIATAEFLIADLTGERPNVYYEVGYAHALGKRVILYRRKNTPVHFDLSIHNCPEYENVKDLKAQLKKRLEFITNKKMNSLA